MDQSFESQPRDSRLEKFSDAACNIISVERGLTSTALSKIRHLAMQQHLSEDQVIECLDRIGDGGSTLGRVGRYEQIFLDRLDAVLPRLNGAVLTPQKAQEAIRLATEEYQISAQRAQQLLDHVAKKRGLKQISAADARNRIRVLIAQRLESPDHRREDFEDGLIAHGANFGISADEVRTLLDSEIETRNRLSAIHKRQLMGVIGSVLLAIGLTVAGCWLWLNTQTLSPLQPKATAPNIIEIENTEASSAVATPADPQNQVTQPTKNLSVSANDDSRFGVNEFFLTPSTAPVMRFEKWQKRFIELVNQDFERPWPELTTPSFADRQKKREALDALESEKSNERIHARALDDLTVLAERISDITSEEATSIAAFCFRKHSASTEVAIVRTVKQFGRWPNFLLAVSDAFAGKDRQSSTDDWKLRIAFAITDGKLKSNDDFQAAFFALARLRVQERLSEHEHTKADLKTNVEGDFVGHLRQFISDSINDQRHQRFFYRLIAARDLTKPSMQRQIELQQILVEALLFAKPDDVSLAAAETHFSRLNSATTLGEQLALSRQSTRRLVTRHLQWLKEPAAKPSAFEHRQPVRLNVTEARRLRDEAENAAMSGDGTQIDNAVAKYEAAIGCGDAATIRSCLRGLIAIAKNRPELNRYHRQLDFVNGGHQSPLSTFTGDAGNVNSTPTDWQAIIRQCRQLRRSPMPQDKSAKPSPGKPADIWAALNWLANRGSPLTGFELELLLRIESEAIEMLDSSKTPLSQIRLPSSVQATLPPVEVTPLVPLGR